jgi:phenylpropionate dioxygenase-like ring-hydroxylating dioxygenase large terminal subunit
MNPDVDDVPTWLAGAKLYLDYFIDRAPGGNLSVRNKHRLTFNGNWKLAWDNAGDGLHATFAHKSFALLNEVRYGGAKSLSQFKHTPDDTGMFGEDCGNGHIFVDQRPGISGSFWETQRPIPGREHQAETIRAEHGENADAVLEAAPGAMINLSIFPNLLIKGNQMEILTPKSVGRSELHLWICAAADAPDEVNTLRMRIAEDFPTLGNPDDVDIYERCQRGLTNVPEIEWMDVSKGIGTETSEMRNGVEVLRAPVTYETPIRGYLKEWKRAMAADPKITTV